MVKERAAEQKPAPNATPPQASKISSSIPSAKTSIHESSKRVAQGSKRFGKAFLGPLGHAASVLWLEITGVFFALFALFCLQSLWRVRSAYISGPDHQKFILYAILSLVFAYFCVSSFFRARRKESRRR
jgi:hypothetical protein